MEIFHIEGIKEDVMLEIKYSDTELFQSLFTYYISIT